MTEPILINYPALKQPLDASDSQIVVNVDASLGEGLIVRRYIDLPKFLDLLASQELYLPRADGFPDRLEGSLTPSLRTTLDEAHRRGASEDSANDFYRRGREGNFVSCWTLGDSENMAFWSSYAGVKTGLALMTDVGKLISTALKWDQGTLIHKVEYVDHVRNPAMLVGKCSDMLRFKNLAYKFEDELRIVVSRSGPGWEKNPGGLRMPLGSVDDLIKAVVIAPEAQNWYFDSINELCVRFGLHCPVLRSRLADLPI